MPNEMMDQKVLVNPKKFRSEISAETRLQNRINKMQFYYNNLWEARKKFIIFNIIVIILVLSYLFFLTDPYFTSTVTILPDYGSKESTLGQLGSLAALAGVNVGSGSPTEIYQNLIYSESVLIPVIYGKYKTNKLIDSVNLIQYLEIKPDKNISVDIQNRDMFIKAFNLMVKIKLSSEVDRLTKILTVTVQMSEAQLSADVVNNVAQSLDNYIRTKRKSYASEQRQYIEKRLLQVKDSLNYVENKLMYFKERNRVVLQSPVLMLEQGRLLRNVEIMNAVYLELSKQLELAKISEVKDTPVLNIKEFARNPVVKTGPKRLVSFIIILFMSLLLSGTYFVLGKSLKKYWLIFKLRSSELKPQNK